MHSLFSIALFCTIPFTSRLIGHSRVHRLQSVHASVFAFKRSAGHAKTFLIALPMIMNGAIQQM